MAARRGLAQMNLILHDKPGGQIHPNNSTLAAPFFKEGESLKTFDYVVANPPFSDKRWGQGMDPNELMPGCRDWRGKHRHSELPPL